MDRIGGLFDKTSNEKLVLTRAEFREYLRIPISTLAYLINKGVILNFILRDHRRYLKLEIFIIGK